MKTTVAPPTGAALVRDAQVVLLITDEMTKAHYSPEDAAAAPGYVWRLAASIVGVATPSLAVRVATVAVLIDRAEKSQCHRSRR